MLNTKVQAEGLPMTSPEPPLTLPTASPPITSSPSQVEPEEGCRSSCSISHPCFIFLIETGLALLVLLTAIAMLIKDKDINDAYAQRAWYIFGIMVGIAHFLFQLILIVGPLKRNDAYILVWIVWNALFAIFLLGYAINLPFKHFTLALEKQEAVMGIIAILGSVLYLIAFCIQIYSVRVIHIRWKLMRRKQQQLLQELETLKHYVDHLIPPTPSPTSDQNKPSSVTSQVSLSKTEGLGLSGIIPSIGESTV